MKQILLSGIIMLCTLATFAQTDTTIHNNNGDTVMVGNFIIIKNHKEADTNNDSVPPKREHYTIININKNRSNQAQTPPRKKLIQTNYFILDLGFANYNDKTDYSSAAAQAFAPGFDKSDLKLKTGKSSNVNLWLFMQKLNITNHVLNLKYGLGLEMFNYRFKNDISFHDDAPYVTPDTINFSKNKLYVGYATIPFMININPSPNRKHRFSLSAGVSAGYKIASHSKQVSDERGKQKLHEDFDLNPWRFAYVAELGLGPVRLYGSYSINELFQDGLKQYPYTVGIRFSNW